MQVVASLIIGFLLGVIAKLLMPVSKAGIFKVTELIGVAGAFIGFEIGSLAGIYHDHNPTGYLASIAGAVILLGLFYGATRIRSFKN